MEVVLHKGLMSYTRRAVHWDADTRGRRDFERQVRQTIKDDGELVYLDSTDSFDEIDFELGCRGRRLFVEVKEKLQHYRAAWQEASAVPEEDLFILDELAARKIILRAPRAYLLIHDAICERLSVFGALELLTAPKDRLDRSIEANVATFKGKWLIDLLHGFECASLAEALDYIKRRSTSEEDAWQGLACHGRYRDEHLPRI